MFYDDLDKMDDYEKSDYCWEMVDGLPRYRRYKNSINVVHLIKSSDDHHNIENSSFADLEYYYDSVNWVALNDPEALKHIMGEINKPVNDLVKKKFLKNLEALKYFEACVIVKKYLAAFPVPIERTHQREREKALKDIDFLVCRLKSTSELLYKFKTEQQEKLYDENLKDSLGTILKIDGLFKSYIPKEIEAMEWLRINSANDLREQYSFKVCIEIKDQLINILSENEKFKLCDFINKTLGTHDMPYYYEIPPHNPNQKSRFYSDYDDDDDDDNY